MDVPIYMLYVAGRAFLWRSRERDDDFAKATARELMRNMPPVSIGRLFAGPTGIHEMEFVGRIKL